MTVKGPISHIEKTPGQWMLARNPITEKIPVTGRRDSENGCGHCPRCCYAPSLRFRW